MNDKPTFKTFWDLYRLKRDRMAAERAWNRLTTSERRKAIEGIERYREDCERRGIHMMYGQGYLNHHRWEDETEAESPSPAPSAPSANSCQFLPNLQETEKDDMEVW